MNERYQDDKRKTSEVLVHHHASLVFHDSKTSLRIKDNSEN